MLATLRKAIPIPRLDPRRLTTVLAPATAVLAFIGLLATDNVPPIVIYLLELYLVF